MVKMVLQRELLIRIDERVNQLQIEQAKFSVLMETYNKRLDDICVNTEHWSTTLTNHINMHKRDIGLIGIGLTILTIIISLAFKLL